MFEPSFYVSLIDEARYFEKDYVNIVLKKHF